MTAGVRLRPFGRADMPDLPGWFPTEAALVQWGGPEVRFPLDAPQIEAMLADGEGDPPRRLLWAGERDGRLAAHAQAALDWRHGVARLGRVGVDPALRGQGVAVPFLRQALRQVFALPGFERVELHVYTFNHAAIRTYRTLGFTEEGVRRSSVRVGTARWDAAIFGLLRGECTALADQA